MYDLQIFEHQDFGQVRTLEVDGEIWFVAADVCKALDHSNPTMALDRLDDDERAKFNLGRQGETNCVNEPGLYSLVLGSRKPEAKAFKRWITHEVIPALRRTGSYTVNSAARAITTDDYLKAAQIVANCRNERLPYVMSFLRQAGITVPEKELAALNAKQPDTFLTKAERDAIVDEAIDILLMCPLTVREMARRTNIQPENKLSQYRHGQRRPSVQRAQHIIATLKDVGTKHDEVETEVRA